MAERIDSQAVAGARELLLASDHLELAIAHFEKGGCERFAGVAQFVGKSIHELAIQISAEVFG